MGDLLQANEQCTARRSYSRSPLGWRGIPTVLVAGEPMTAQATIPALGLGCDLGAQIGSRISRPHPRIQSRAETPAGSFSLRYRAGVFLIGAECRAAKLAALHNYRRRKFCWPEPLPALFPN